VSYRKGFGGGVARHGALGHVAYPPPLEFDARKILQPFFASTYRPITHVKALITVTVAGCCKKNFSRVRFYRPNAFTSGRLCHHELRNPCATRPCPPPPLPWSKILATPLGFGAKPLRYDTIRYDTRCYFNVRSKADISQLNLPHGTDNIKSVKTEKLKSKKTDMLRSNSKQSGRSI